MKYKLICMSFDGEFQTESPKFNSIDDAWNYSNDLGSKWYFYPFHFVTTESGKTIRSTPINLERFEGLRTKTVAGVFNKNSKREELKNAGIEEFILEMVG